MKYGEASLAINLKIKRANYIRQSNIILLGDLNNIDQASIYIDALNRLKNLDSEYTIQ